MLGRRTFLKATVATAGGLALGPGCSETEAPKYEGGESFFPQSIASGDPTPTSVVLWTRLDDPDASEDEAIWVAVQVARDEAFTRVLRLAGLAALPVMAEARFDGCVKVRVDGLDPSTTYYYRFFYEKDGVRWTSRTGRTRTAPAADADVPVRFAFLSCQDFGGRYYNVLARLAVEDVDFVVHLGDYIYETSGDPRFQEPSAVERGVFFDDVDGAIAIGQGNEAFLAARSLDNYRQLYRLYRSDPALQRVHERFPMIVIWDDHEFADDSHGATATHFNGRTDETDPERRRHASQAWWEYVPVEYRDRNFAYDPTVDFPEDIEIWRSFRFGKHLHLVLTDLRTRRADHMIAEDAYPGEVALDEPTLVGLLGEIPTEARPYVDVDTHASGVYADLLRDAAAMAGYDTDRIGGLVSVDWINRTVAQTGSSLPPLTEDEQTGLPRGIAYLQLGKTGLFSALGARQFVPKAAFDIYARFRWNESDGAAQQMMGDVQEEWFLNEMTTSTATWRVWANEFCLIPLQVDLTSLPIPDEFRRQYYLSLDQWDGYRDRRDRILDRLSTTKNVVAITGDVHAFFAGTPWVDGDRTKKIVELVGSSVSSKTYEEILADTVENTELKDVPGAADLAAAIGDLLTLTSGPNPHIAEARTGDHGFVVVDIDGTRLEATYYMAGTEIVREPRYDEDLIDAFRTVRFRVNRDEPELEQDFGGTWKRWNPETRGWDG